LKLAAGIHFGEWMKTIVQAGLERSHRTFGTGRKPRLNTPPSKVLSALRKRADDGKMLVAHLVGKDNQTLRKAACRFFGSWENVIEAAGLTECLRKQKESTNHAYRAVVTKYASRESVVEFLRKRAAEQKPISAKEVKCEDTSLIYHARRLFGDWHSAVQAAGLSEIYYRENPDAFQKYPDKESVLRSIQEREANGLSLL
jgi:hypothetical protein